MGDRSYASAECVRYMIAATGPSSSAGRQQRWGSSSSDELVCTACSHRGEKPFPEAKRTAFNELVEETADWPDDERRETGRLASPEPREKPRGTIVGREATRVERLMRVRLLSPFPERHKNALGSNKLVAQDAGLVVSGPKARDVLTGLVHVGPNGRSLLVSIPLIKLQTIARDCVG